MKKTTVKQQLPLVTIGILTYNNISTKNVSEKDLEKNLLSFFKQTYSNLEIIIQDDNSSDNTFEIVKKVSKKYPFVTIYKNRKNLGLGKNIYSLSKKIQGDYFCWWCVDDYYFPTYIEKAVKILTDNPERVACQSYTKFNLSDRTVDLFYDGIDPCQESYDQKELKELLFRGGTCSKPNTGLSVFIAGMMRVQSAKVIFSCPNLLYFELSVPVLLIWMGGLCAIPEFLFINDAKEPFGSRYPESNFFKNTKNFLFLFRSTLNILFFLLKIHKRGLLKTNLFSILSMWKSLTWHYAIIPFIWKEQQILIGIKKCFKMKLNTLFHTLFHYKD